MSVWTRRLALAAAFIIAALVAGPASAQTKLKWAHVYEIGEPYHTQALWAADEIKKRTNGKYEIQVFPASQLGNENQINEGLGLGTVDGQENPLPTIMAKKFYEVQSHVMLTGHIVESLLTIVGTHVWTKLSDTDKKVFDEVLVQGAAKASDEIRASEQKIADELRKLGKTVVQVDREAFRKAAIPLHNDASAGAGWSQAEYDALQALK